uniref:Metalloendopeptidase n=1 Tax=Timema douglasi TaxID=61478 RepID=A0A7R8VP73_TIMDO|nr:unnamed protein product [Timema douglasi]
MASFLISLTAFLGTLLQLCGTQPLDEVIPDVGTLAEQRHQFPWQVSGKFQGDIMLKVSDNARNGLKDKITRWPNGVVPYYIDPMFSADQVATIHSAFNEFHTRTCIRFRPYATTDRDYIYIDGDSTGCWSYVGRLNGASGQLLNLQLNGCVHHGVAVHELLHALGFFHQQSATERDEYVRILWWNIESGMEYNFDMYDDTYITNYDTEYDYKSIMHYDGYAFSSNGQPTIQAISGDVTLGQIVEMTEKDIIKLEKMYGCRS